MHESSLDFVKVVHPIDDTDKCLHTIHGFDADASGAWGETERVVTGVVLGLFLLSLFLEACDVEK